VRTQFEVLGRLSACESIVEDLTRRRISPDGEVREEPLDEVAMAKAVGELQTLEWLLGR